MTDKFISINYRKTDNSRHTVQIEQFYIDALKAIGIDDIVKFVTDNVGLTQVTRNVKKAIVNELVKRITGEQPNELNIIQPDDVVVAKPVASELNIIQPDDVVAAKPMPSELNIIHQSTPFEYGDLHNLPASKFDTRCTQITNKNSICKKPAFKIGYCKIHYTQYMKNRR